jgi:hypothetical protein
MPSTTPSISAPMRSFISRAALLVKVTARIWPGAARRKDVREPGGQDPGLGGAGACEHQHRPVGREHRVPLLLVQTLEMRRVALGRGRSPPVAKGGVERVTIRVKIRGHVPL